MNAPLEVHEYKGYKISIYQDEHPQNPRDEFDHLGQFVTWHRTVQIDPPHGLTAKEFELSVKPGDVLVPVYMLDHSGQTISHQPFACPWDSGQLGFIVARAGAIRKWYEVRRITQKIRDWVKEELIGEIKEYDDYLTGSVYGYVVEDHAGHCVGSCWGYSGEGVKKWMLEEAKAEADEDLKQWGGVRQDNAV